MRRTLWTAPPPAVETAPPLVAPWGSNAAETEVVAPPPSPAPPALPRPVDMLRVATSKVRQRNWEKKNTGVSYRGVPRAVQQALKATALELGVTQDDLGRAFLQHSWQAWQQGLLPLHPQVKQGRWVIVPNDAPDAVPTPSLKPRRTKASKDWQSVVKFRYMPEELKAGINQVADTLHVRVGAVASVFLRHALDDYRSGKLVLSVRPAPGRLELE